MDAAETGTEGTGGRRNRLTRFVAKIFHVRHPELVLPAGPRPDVYVARLRFLRAIERVVPDVLTSLATCPKHDAAALSAWAERWNLTDAWLLDIARDTFRGWENGQAIRRHLSSDPEYVDPMRGEIIERRVLEDGQTLHVFRYPRSFAVTTRINHNQPDETLHKVAELGLVIERSDDLLVQLPTLRPFQLAESGTEYLAEMRAELDRTLREQVDERKAEAKAAGAVPVKRKRARGKKLATVGLFPEDRHFEWLARSQCLGETQPAIAETEGKDWKTVQDAIRDTAQLIGLTRRTTV